MKIFNSKLVTPLDFLLSSKQLQIEINGDIIKLIVFVSELRPTTDR